MEETFANRSEGIIKGRYYGKLKEIIENAVKKQNWYQHSLICLKNLKITFYKKIIDRLTI